MENNINKKIKVKTAELIHEINLKDDSMQRFSITLSVVTKILGFGLASCIKHDKLEHTLQIIMTALPTMIKEESESAIKEFFSDEEKAMEEKENGEN